MSLQLLLLILSLDALIVFKLFNSKILQKKERYWLIPTFILRLIGIFFLLNYSDYNSWVSSFFFFITSLFSLFLEFYLLYTFTTSYLAATIFIMTNLTILQLSLFFVFFFNILLKDNPSSNSLFYYKSISILLQPLFLVFLLLLFNLLNRHFNFIYYLVNTTKKYTLYSVIAFINFISIYSFAFYFAQTTNLQLFFVSNTLLYVFTASTYFLMVRNVQKLQQINFLQLQLQERYSDTHLTEELIKFRHDYKSILMSLSLALDRKDIPLAKEQLTDIIQYSSPFLANNFYEQLEKLTIMPVNSFLLSFLQHCKEHNISTTITITENISSVAMSAIDLTRCISILCNNSFEEVSHQKKPVISITLSCSNNRFIFTIENSIEEKVDLEKLTWKGYSSKQDHHGLGLYIFRKIMNQYKHTDYSIDYTNKIISIQFSIPSSTALV